jgi:hypothetical protein
MYCASMLDCLTLQKLIFFFSFLKIIYSKWRVYENYLANFNFSENCFSAAYSRAELLGKRMIICKKKIIRIFLLFLCWEQTFNRKDLSLSFSLRGIFRGLGAPASRWAH